MEPRLLILETSQRVGRVALADGDTLLGERVLDESRRHARDLVPSLRELLAEQGWTARSLAGIIVSRGPGSYTGLRVGLISAKTLAYATGCVLLAIDTFTALARQAPAGAAVIDVIADAQQDKVYAQRFLPAGAAPLMILPFAEWLNELDERTCVIGPGLETYAQRLPESVRVAPPESWLPSPQALLAVGLERYQRGERDDPFAVEPLYLRQSAAEEQWQRLGRQ